MAHKWTSLGSVPNADGRPVEVKRRDDGRVFLDVTTAYPEFLPDGVDRLSELLGRAAMPGQPADGGPPAGEASQHG